MIDLQSHSTVSDGQLAPAEVARAAAEAGGTTKSLTDQDAGDGVPAAGGAAGGGGVAHPYWDVSRPEQVRDLVESLVREVGLDGIEAFYPPHTAEQTQHLLELCEEFGLVPTGSSDFHGPTHKQFSRFGAYDTYGLGSPEVPGRYRGPAGGISPC